MQVYLEFNLHSHIRRYYNHRFHLMAMTTVFNSAVLTPLIVFNDGFILDTRNDEVFNSTILTPLIVFNDDFITATKIQISNSERNRKLVVPVDRARHNLTQWRSCLDWSKIKGIGRPDLARQDFRISPFFVFLES